MKHYSLEIDAITLSEAASLAFRETQQMHNATDILRFACVRRNTENPLPVYAVSHDFVMTQAVEGDTAFHGSVKGTKALSHIEKISAYRSFGRGELYQLHPAFIERLALLGSMKITDCRIHTITTARSSIKIPGWKRQDDVGQKKCYWQRTFDSSITPTEDISIIEFTDLRIDRADFRSYLNAKAVVTAQANTKEIVIVPKETGPSSWVLRVQIEASARIQRLRAANANPTINSICGDLAKWCVENNVRTPTGTHPASETIRRHALREWTPPKAN